MLAHLKMSFQYDELASKGNFSREDIVTMLTAHEGSSDAAFQVIIVITVIIIIIVFIVIIVIIVSIVIIVEFNFSIIVIIFILQQDQNWKEGAQVLSVRKRKEILPDDPTKALPGIFEYWGIGFFLETTTQIICDL